MCRYETHCQFDQRQCKSNGTEYAFFGDDPKEPDYTRPKDAPDCVAVVDDVYYAYFEEPRFCWDEPIYCKVRTADDTTTDLHSNQDGSLCEYVGTTASGRKIWRWTGHSTIENPPVELIFTNHDLLTDIMPFVNGGYYNYDRLVYKADQTVPTSIARTNIYNQRGNEGTDATTSDGWFTLDGRRIAHRPTANGVYIREHKKVVVTNM